MGAYNQFRSDAPSLGGYFTEVGIGTLSGVAFGGALSGAYRIGAATGFNSAVAGLAGQGLRVAGSVAGSGLNFARLGLASLPRIRVSFDPSRIGSTFFSDPTGIGALGQALNITVHRNSLSYVGPTHVYRIIGPDGKTFKIGESALGTISRGAGAGLSRRGEAQARALFKRTGLEFRSEIIKNFGSKRAARAYENQVIERFRASYPEEQFGFRVLPGNRTNR